MQKHTNKSGKKTKRSNEQASTMVQSNTGVDVKNIQLPGRHACLCEATKHSLIGNCLNCGRIVCEQEGVGPCFTCNQYVFSLHQRQEIRLKTNAGQELLDAHQLQLQASLPTGLKDIAQTFDKAQQFKNRLIEYDNSSQQRTKVIDDETDYFKLSSQHWMSAARRDEVENAVEDLHEKKKKSEHKLVIDVADKKIFHQRSSVIEDVGAEINRIQVMATDLPNTDASYASEINNEVKLPKPEYIDSGNQKSDQSGKQLQSASVLKNLRVQDASLTEMSDEGVCLSMHQPWASLLMSGIKLHEGRTWYTSYRGRVWIHAGSRNVEKNEISRAENFFSLVADSQNFPKTYPKGVVLGFARLVDCLPQEEYKEIYPQGYVDNLYVFIFENPTPLRVPIPMSGQPKLFTMDSQYFKAALKQI